MSMTAQQSALLDINNQAALERARAPLIDAQLANQAKVLAYDQKAKILGLTVPQAAALPAQTSGTLFQGAATATQAAQSAIQTLVDKFSLNKTAVLLPILAVVGIIIFGLVVWMVKK
jgi:nitrate reductase NapE component